MNIKKLVGAAAAILGTAGLMKLFGKKKPQKYGDKWFDTVTDEVLEKERENVRKQFCAAGKDISLASSLQNMLNRFNAEMCKRAWKGEEPQPPSYHREHGYNLYKKD